MKSLNLGMMLIVLLLASTMVLADLSTFPDDFVEGDAFDGAIVVAEHGSGHDFVGATQLATELLKDTSSVAGGETPSELQLPTDHYQIEEYHNFLEGAEYIHSVRPEITADEMTILAPGSVTNQRGTFNYEQVLFPGKMLVTTAIADDVPDDPKDMPATYLKIYEDPAAPSPPYGYEYKVSFNPPLESEIKEAEDFALDDLEGEELHLLGDIYVVLKADHPSKDSIELTLMRDSAIVVLQEGETKTVTVEGKDYEVTALFIADSNSDGVSAKLMINGETTPKMDERDSQTLDDQTTVIVKSIMSNPRGGVVDVAIGSSKLVLTDTNVTDGAYGGDRWEVDRENVKDTDFKMEALDDGLTDGGLFRIKSMSFKWVPSKTHYVGGGQRLSQILEDPNQIFGQDFDISYDGPTSDLVMEGVKLEPKGNDEYRLVFTNKLGQVLDVPMFYDNSGTFSRFGDDDHELHLEEAVNISRGEYFMVTSDGSADPTEARGYTHLLRYESQDVGDNLIEIEDVATDDTYEIRYEDGASTAVLTIDGYDYDMTFQDTANNGDIQVDLDNDGSINVNETPVLVTQFGMALIPDVTGPYAYKRFNTISPERQDVFIGTGYIDPIFLGIDTFVRTILADPAVLNETLDASVNGTMPITRWFDAQRFTIEDDNGEIDISNIDRCLDGGDPVQVERAISHQYDDNATITVALAAVGATLGITEACNGAQVMSECIKYLYYDINYAASSLYGCYPLSSSVIGTALLDVGDTDDKVITSAYGQKTTWYGVNSGPDKMTMYSAKMPAEHKVLFHNAHAQESAPATTTTVNMGDVETLLDTNVAAVDRDMIVIGGPCINKVAAMLLGDENCANGFEPGKGRLTLTEKDGHNVLIIAGYEGDETLFATKALLEAGDQLTGGNDLVVSGNLDDLTVEEYVAPEGGALVAPPVDEPEETPEDAGEEMAAPVYDCEASNDVAGNYNLEIKKMGLTKETTSNPRVVMTGRDGVMSYTVSEAFEAQLGVNWLQYKVHILKGDCDGAEVTSLTFKWEDGDGDKEQSFTVPEEGCYCVKIENKDVTIDNADIEMVSNNGLFTMPFSTASAEENMVTGNVISPFGSTFVEMQPLSDMNIWNN